MQNQCAKRSRPAAPFQFARRHGTTLALLLSDLTALTLAAFIALALRNLGDDFHPELYTDLWPVLGLFLAAYALLGLYPGVGRSKPEELRQLTLATTMICLVLGATTFLVRDGWIYSRAVFLIGWAAALLLVPLGRGVVRALCAHRSWWGRSVAILGSGPTAQRVIRTLQRDPSRGLRPAMVLSNDLPPGSTVEGVPVRGPLSVAEQLPVDTRLHYAIVAMPENPRREQMALVETCSQRFPHLIVIPDLAGFSSLWVTGRDLGGVLGLEVQQRLLKPGRQYAKRLLDLALTLMGGVAVSPLFALLALWIKLDSPGPVFYRQQRLGLNGTTFSALKFRSMYGDGEALLEELLTSNPELAEEYQQFHKIRNDPRITRAGRFLRRTSLDELPQIWNVLKGEMSLVGPRAYLPRETEYMQDSESVILRVLPGITGIWQVSGRNELTFEERLAIDQYYVRNWSVWLDAHILSRTLGVVIRGEGAF